MFVLYHQRSIFCDLEMGQIAVANDAQIMVLTAAAIHSLSCVINEIYK